MTLARLEHVNVTVSDPERAAALMEDLFGWHVRWRGPAKAGGRTVHVGTDAQYVAFYAQASGDYPDGFARQGALNHIAVEVDDLDAIERRVIAAGLTPFHHGDYEPGRRFYFLDADGIEFEIVSYRPARAATEPAARQPEPA
jgi:catechol 2,3-dioxygenase-like lactoylglutathione lyase family enzyme